MHFFFFLSFFCWVADRGVEPLTPHRSATVTLPLEIDHFVPWCERNYLELHVGKTKEMVIDFRREHGHSAPVVIKGNAIERAETVKYLGVLFDDKLSWKQNANVVLKKANTRLFCLRKLKILTSFQNCFRCFTPRLCLAFLLSVSCPGVGTFADVTERSWTKS